ncbi:MAG: single-stranded DNA-binding protein [Clostridia bacterium]|nr:single-stranded DNA-binding protein [Clostridia bacterium]
MLNKVILMGRITRDIELKYTQSNTAVCSFSVAVERNFVRQGEERQVDFINVVAWRQQAEFVAKYFGKGRMINVVGSLQTRTWDDQNGQKHYATEVIAEEINFCGEPKQDGSGAKPAQNFQPETNFGAPQSEPTGFQPIDIDDDLPF